MVLFDVGGFLRRVLQLHGHLLQLFVQLFEQKNTDIIILAVLLWIRYIYR